MAIEQKIRPYPKPPDAVRLVSIRLQYYQQADSADVGDETQELIVGTADAGGGAYPYISIPSGRWAMDHDQVQWLADIMAWAADFVDGWSGGDADHE